MNDPDYVDSDATYFSDAEVPSLIQEGHINNHNPKTERKCNGIDVNDPSRLNPDAVHTSVEFDLVRADNESEILSENLIPNSEDGCNVNLQNRLVGPSELLPSVDMDGSRADEYESIIHDFDSSLSLKDHFNSSTHPKTSPIPRKSLKAFNRNQCQQHSRKESYSDPSGLCRDNMFDMESSEIEIIPHSDPYPFTCKSKAESKRSSYSKKRQVLEQHRLKMKMHSQTLISRLGDIRQEVSMWYIGCGPKLDESRAFALFQEVKSLKEILSQLFCASRRLIYHIGGKAPMNAIEYSAVNQTCERLLIQLNPASLEKDFIPLNERAESDFESSSSQINEVLDDEDDTNYMDVEGDDISTSKIFNTKGVRFQSPLPRRPFHTPSGTVNKSTSSSLVQKENVNDPTTVTRSRTGSRQCTLNSSFMTDEVPPKNLQSHSIECNGKNGNKPENSVDRCLMEHSTGQSDSSDGKKSTDLLHGEQLNSTKEIVTSTSNSDNPSSIELTRSLIREFPISDKNSAGVLTATTNIKTPSLNKNSFKELKDPPNTTQTLQSLPLQEKMDHPRRIDPQNGKTSSEFRAELVENQSEDLSTYCSLANKLSVHESGKNDHHLLPMRSTSNDKNQSIMVAPGNSDLNLQDLMNDAFLSSDDDDDLTQLSCTQLSSQSTCIFSTNENNSQNNSFKGETSSLSLTQIEPMLQNNGLPVEVECDSQRSDVMKEQNVAPSIGSSVSQPPAWCNIFEQHHNNKTLPTLTELMLAGMISPGEITLRLKDKEVKAKLLKNAKILTSDGATFHSPMVWCSAWHDGRNISKNQAYQRVIYNGTTLMDICKKAFDVATKEIAMSAESQDLCMESVSADLMKYDTDATVSSAVVDNDIEVIVHRTEEVVKDPILAINSLYFHGCDEFKYDDNYQCIWDGGILPLEKFSSIDCW